jgi:HD-GYP domain-containing protein (c-di-GMP phosphodiesterase class II)/class 3 adenylate cyclase
MEKVKRYVLKNFEQFFVLIILAVTATIYHFIDQKLAFLNFYFLPIVLSGVYLGTRKSVIGALFSTLMVLFYVIDSPAKFYGDRSAIELYLHLTIWASFLLLVAAVVGKQHEKLASSLDSMGKLNLSLQNKQEEINVANQSLKDYSTNLEEMVKIRTEELQKSKQTLESLKSKVEATLYSTMDSSVARLIIEGRIRSDKRKVSILFADLNGFTSYAEERSPELVVKDLNRYLSEMEPIIDAYHGHLDKFLGDGLMCEFGAPFDYENYRLLSVLTGLKMQEKMKELQLPWRMRIGVASGAAITGLIGARRQSYTSIGDVVNVASRLESNCPVGEFLIDEYTYEGCKRFIDVHVYHLEGNTEADDLARTSLAQITNSLNETKDDSVMAVIYEQKSKLETSLGELDLAFDSIEKAVNLQPQNPSYRLAMADLVIARQTENKLKLKGRKKTVKAYKVVGIKNTLMDYEKIPEQLMNKFLPALSGITIPSDLTLRVEAVDGTIGHSKAVALLSYAIATKMNMYDKDKVEILTAAFAADLGKVIIPHHLLNRHGTLSSSEMEEVCKHPLESVRILRGLGYESLSLLEMVRHCHERMDGSGYPDNLTGDRIPLGSRIIAVADVYDALTSWRPYREKWDREASLDELTQMAKQGLLDKEVVQTLIDLIEHEQVSQIKTVA